jgi:hypothetical protein
MRLKSSLIGDSATYVPNLRLDWSYTRGQISFKLSGFGWWTAGMSLRLQASFGQRKVFEAFTVATLPW